MKKKFLSQLVTFSLVVATVFTGCQKKENSVPSEKGDEKVSAANAYVAMEVLNNKETNIIDDNYRNFYEIFPYSYMDSNGDGIGDLNGIDLNIDYMKKLGVNGVWLTPIFASPSYHKYDCTNYYEIDPAFGTMKDFENLLKDFHDNDINLILDLVVNHTSTSHPWFQEATTYLRSLNGKEPSSSECPYVEYYNFAKEKATGFEKVSGTDYYYECRFYSGMPDLNLDSELVRSEITNIINFWMDKGIDGFRLDAVTSYYTGNADKNIEFLGWLNDTVKAKKADGYLLGECWENSSSYANYYKSQVDSFFNYDFATQNGTIASTIKTNNALGFAKNVVAVSEMIKANNPNYIDAAFTGGHDNARTAGCFPGDYSVSQTKLAQAFAMFMGGNYILYYGDELGMKGSGDDENKRLPMQWSSNASDAGMCKYIGTRKVEMTNGSYADQEMDKDSIFYYVKEGLKLRNIYPEIARGTTSVLEDVSTQEVVVMKKEYNGSEILVVINSSTESKSIDLSSVSVNGKENGQIEPCGTLLVDKNMVEVNGSTLDMPAFSVEILK